MQPTSTPNIAPPGTPALCAEQLSRISICEDNGQCLCPTRQFRACDAGGQQHVLHVWGNPRQACSP